MDSLAKDAEQDAGQLSGENSSQSKACEGVSIMSRESLSNNVSADAPSFDSSAS